MSPTVRNPETVEEQLTWGCRWLITEIIKDPQQTRKHYHTWAGRTSSKGEEQALAPWTCPQCDRTGGGNTLTMPTTNRPTESEQSTKYYWCQGPVCAGGTHPSGFIDTTAPLKTCCAFREGNNPSNTVGCGHVTASGSCCLALQCNTEHCGGITGCEQVRECYGNSSTYDLPTGPHFLSCSLLVQW